MGNNMGKRGFAQPRRAKQQDMIQGFLAFACSGDENFKLFANPVLAGIFGQGFGAQGTFYRFLIR